MDTNVEKNNQTASQLQPAVGGELDPQVGSSGKPNNHMSEIPTHGCQRPVETRLREEAREIEERKERKERK